jgi:NAD(P)-dependent dehydrogenase (short-subunit alcohol dehydrogenase family)
MSGSSGRLESKVAVVTGAAAGIGRATAVRFASEGARLVVNDVDAAGLERLAEQVNGEFGAEVTSVVGDVSQDADARRIVEAAVTAYAGLDVLVANAGIIELGTLADSTPDDWDHVMSVDGRGMFLTCKYAVAAMRQAGRGGSVICLSSISGLAGQKGQATYGPAKFVATGLTKHLAVARSTSRRSSPSTRWVAWAAPTRSRPRSSSSPATTRRSSPARCCRSTEASSRSRPDETRRRQPVGFPDESHACCGSPHNSW